MDKERVVLVTGVAGYWGGRVATRLLEEPDLHVIGLDSVRPQSAIDGLDFVEADLRNPLLAELLASEGVEVVCHLSSRPAAGVDTGEAGINLAGAMKLIGACAEAGVSRVVLKSSTAVYGAQPTNSAFLREDSPLRGSKKVRRIRDLVEIELFCEGFRGQATATDLTVLRFANCVGRQVDSPFTRYLKLPALPKLMGFDPLMQLIHTSDVVEALAWATIGQANGVINVAADGPLPLSRILKLLRRPIVPIFHPLAYRGSRLMAEKGPDVARWERVEWDYLRYSWVADTGRMGEMGFSPLYTAVEALKEFAAAAPDTDADDIDAALARDETRLRETLVRRQRARGHTDYDPAEVAS